jgi:CDP-glucose 4,6-dehydratase
VHGYRETDRLGGHDPYSASKAAAEIAAASYAKSFFPADSVAGHGTALATVRAGNVIGGGDFATDRLVPDMARAFAKGQPVCIRRPGAVRPWQHVLEPVAGYLLLARRMLEAGHAFAGAWNFGPGSEDVRTVGEVAKRFAGCWGGGARLDLNTGADNGPHEAGLLTLDCAKARALLGWRPRTGLDTALDWTCAWYRAWAGGADDLRAVTRATIADFLAG